MLPGTIQAGAQPRASHGAWSSDSSDDIGDVAGAPAAGDHDRNQLRPPQQQRRAGEQQHLLRHHQAPPHHGDTGRLLHSLQTLHLRRFGECVGYILLYPVSIPLLLAVRGAVAAKNMGLWPGHLLFNLFTVQSLAFVAVVSAWIALLGAGQGQMILFTVAVTFVAVRVLVAVRFAYLSYDMYDAVMTRPLTERELSHLSTAQWARLTPDRIRSEFEVLQGRLGLDQSRTSFSLAPNGTGRLRQLLPSISAADHILAKGKISVTDLLSAIYATSRNRVPFAFWPLMSCFHASVFTGLVVNELIRRVPLDGGPPVAAVACVVVVLWFQTAIIVFSLIFASVDTNRRYRAMLLYASLFCLHEGAAVDEPPLVSLLVVDNVQMYLLGRRLLCLAGHSFVKQWELLSSVIATAVLATCIVLVFHPDLAPLYMTMLVVVMLMLPIVAAIFWGSRVNDLFVSDHAMLVTKASEAWDAHVQHLMAGDEDMSFVFQECERALTLTATQLQADRNVYPVRFLGFEASDNLNKSLILTLLSVASAVWKGQTIV